MLLSPLIPGLRSPTGDQDVTARCVREDGKPLPGRRSSIPGRLERPAGPAAPQQGRQSAPLGISLIQVRAETAPARDTFRMNASLHVDADTLRRYDQPGPRYTSYPTAPHFGPHFTEAMLREYIRRGNDEPIPRLLSLYVHIPFCFSPCFYCGCNRIITRDLTRTRPYLERLQREIEMTGNLFDRDREVIQVHLGGGTPNFMRPAEIGELFESLANHFHLST